MTKAQIRSRVPVDPRGIMRRVLAQECHRAGGYVALTFECGHVGRMAAHFDYSGVVGEERRCFQCGQIELRRRAAVEGDEI